MKTSLFSLLLVTLLCTCASAVCQTATGPGETVSDPGIRAQNTFPTPVNDIVAERSNLQRDALPYAPLREADLLWQKRVWRVIDVNEKINHAFANPARPFISILLEAADSNRLQLYSAIDDKFSTPLTEEQRLAITGGVDTVPVTDDGLDFDYVLSAREFNPASVSRYRVQKIWYVDKNSSQMKVRILGIAPLKDEYDGMGNFLFEEPLFWVYYPSARSILAGERAWISDNETAATSWEDVFEMRYFDSSVVKEGNVHDRRIQDYTADGRSQLIQARRLEAERQARESDLWSH